MNLFTRRLFLVLAATWLLAGCTTLERTVTPGRNPATPKQIFVAENLSDNHRVAKRIAAALRDRGLRSESGPLTMMPEKTEAVIHYEDRWTWDFGDSTRQTYTAPPFQHTYDSIGDYDVKLIVRDAAGWP